MRTAILAMTLLAASAGAVVRADDAPLPQRLSGTGLFAPGSHAIAPGVLAFTPQYALWSDGAQKRRWIYLPPGTAIDASDPNAWQFPPGTRLWKEFAYSGPVETRFIERLADGRWRFATYRWTADGSDALLVSPEGESPALPEAPGGRYVFPSREDCLACHEGTVVPVLGFTALQLSPDRDEGALHAQAAAPVLTLPELVARGVLRDLPATMLESPPRIDAADADERAAMGYLHGNCGHCHNDNGPLAALDLSLQQAGDAASVARALETLIQHASDFRLSGLDTRVHPGAPEASLLPARMRSREAASRMPPLGVQLPDSAGIALVERWIQNKTTSERNTQ